jgi:hypothetical protein
VDEDGSALTASFTQWHDSTGIQEAVDCSWSMEEVRPIQHLIVWTVDPSRRKLACTDRNVASSRLAQRDLVKGHNR